MLSVPSTISAIETKTGCVKTRHGFRSWFFNYDTFVCCVTPGIFTSILFSSVDVLMPLVHWSFRPKIQRTLCRHKDSFFLVKIWKTFHAKIQPVLVQTLNIVKLVCTEDTWQDELSVCVRNTMGIITATEVRHSAAWFMPLHFRSMFSRIVDQLLPEIATNSAGKDMDVCLERGLWGKGSPMGVKELLVTKGGGNDPSRDKCRSYSFKHEAKCHCESKETLVILLTNCFEFWKLFLGPSSIIWYWTFSSEKQKGILATVCRKQFSFADRENLTKTTPSYFYKQWSSVICPFFGHGEGLDQNIVPLTQHIAH